MDLETLLNLMFPGDVGRDFPSFSAINDNSISLLPEDIVEAVSRLIADLDVGPDPDVTTIIKEMRREDPVSMHTFLNTVLEIYFCAPEVARCLTGGHAALFPTARTLPEIDTDLLLPVMERAFQE